MHAINQLYPGTASRRASRDRALFCTHLRGDAGQAAAISSCLRRHGLPRLACRGRAVAEQFTAAVCAGP